MQAPKFLVEFECATPDEAAADKASGARSRPVIRRVCVPNSWAGDYHQCARQLGAAADFFAATSQASDAED